MAWGRKQSGGGGCLAPLALIVALAALLLAWAAYRRAGGELGTVLRDAGLPNRGATMEAPEGGGDWRASLERARERLLGRRSEVAGDRNLEQVQRDVAEVRANLERTYRGAGGVTQGAKQQWRELDGDLERLQGELKQGSAKALATLDEALSKIRTATDGRDHDGR